MLFPKRCSRCGDERSPASHDAQPVILVAAARESGLPLPKSLGDNHGTLGIILKSLLIRELVTERPIRPNEELWRETPEPGRTTLVTQQWV